MEKSLSLRIYKNEVAADRLSFIRKSFKVAEESEKVLTVEGEKESILTLYDNYLSSDADFKAAFPEYMTKEERIKYTHDKVQEIILNVGRDLCDIIARGECTEEFWKIREAYLQYMR